MGVGDAARDAKLINGAVNDLALITGQKPEIRKARKSIAQFKLREGMPIGARVTLRGDRMWEFLDRLVSIAPRIRDFRGLERPSSSTARQLPSALPSSRCSTDRRGLDRPAAQHGHHRRHLGDERRQGRALLRALGFPFRRTEQMAKRLWSTRPTKKPKFAVRAYPLCSKCGRPHAVYRKFGLCRICLRGDGPCRRTAGRAEVELVREPLRDDDMIDRRLLDASAQRQLGVPRRRPCRTEDQGEFAGSSSAGVTSATTAPRTPGGQVLVVQLKYGPSRERSLAGLRRVSSPVCGSTRSPPTCLSGPGRGDPISTSSACSPTVQASDRRGRRSPRLRVVRGPDMSRVGKAARPGSVRRRRDDRRAEPVGQGP